MSEADADKLKHMYNCLTTPPPPGSTPTVNTQSVPTVNTPSVPTGTTTTATISNSEPYQQG